MAISETVPIETRVQSILNAKPHSIDVYTGVDVNPFCIAYKKVPTLVEVVARPDLGCPGEAYVMVDHRAVGTESPDVAQRIATALTTAGFLVSVSQEEKAHRVQVKDAGPLVASQWLDPES